MLSSQVEDVEMQDAEDDEDEEDDVAKELGKYMHYPARMFLTLLQIRVMTSRSLNLNRSQTRRMRHHHLARASATLS